MNKAELDPAALSRVDSLIEAGLRQRGYAPLFMSGNWHDEDEDRCIREFIARGVDGIITDRADLALKVLSQRS